MCCGVRWYFTASLFLSLAAFLPSYPLLHLDSHLFFPSSPCPPASIDSSSWSRAVHGLDCPYSLFSRIQTYSSLCLSFSPPPTHTHTPCTPTHTRTHTHLPPFSFLFVFLTFCLSSNPSPLWFFLPFFLSPFSALCSPDGSGELSAACLLCSWPFQSYTYKMSNRSFRNRTRGTDWFHSSEDTFDDADTHWGVFVFFYLLPVFFAVILHLMTLHHAYIA